MVEEKFADWVPKKGEKVFYAQAEGYVSARYKFKDCYIIFVKFNDGNKIPFFSGLNEKKWELY